MQAFTKITGLVAPLDRVNVDTDQIIPKQFLKTIKRTGLREGLFYDWRKQSDGSQDPAFFLNQPRFQGATILLTRDNFGCGSSREHAVWALRDYGFRAILAPSFADIFANNCLKNGLLTVGFHQAELERLLARDAAGVHTLKVDLEKCRISGEDGFEAQFEVDEFTRTCLLKGLDEIGLTLNHEAAIAQYERRQIRRE